MAAPVRTFAIVVALATGLLLVIALLLWARSGFAAAPYVFMRGPAGMVAFGLVAATQLASGLVIANRRPDLVIGHLAIVFAAIVATSAAAIAYLALAGAGVPLPIDARWVAWLPSCLGFPGATFIAIWLGFVFPDGRIGGSRGRALLRLSALGAVLTGTAMALQPGALVLFPSIENPIRLDPSVGGALAVVAAVGAGLLGLGAVAVARQLLARYAGADTIVRAQLRWYVAAAFVLVGGFGVFVVSLVLVPNGSPLGETILVAFMLSAALPPVAIVVAISRYHLFDIDAIISRAFVFGTLTAILAGVYTASIRLFNAMFTAVTGEASDAALVITTLVIAASFTPIKRRLEGVVERRFTAGSAWSPVIDGASPKEPPPVADALPVSTIDAAAADRIVAAFLADPAFRQALAAQVRAAASPVEPPEDGAGAS